MATPGVVGIRVPDGGWHGTYVRYDSTPDELGWKVLDKVVDHSGDLDAVWRDIASPPAGWREAFEVPLEVECAEWFGTGRTEAPLLRDTDPFVRTDVVRWYILDPRARSLSIFTAKDGFADVQERIVFDERGLARFANAPSDPFDWRNRRRDYGMDEPGPTAVRLAWTLGHALQVAGPRMLLTSCTDAPFSKPRYTRATLTKEGLLCPLRFYLTDRPNEDGSWEPWPHITDIVENDEFVMVPRRALRDTARCELVLDAALDAVSACVVEGEVPSLCHPSVFEGLFPFWLLDLELETEVLTNAVREHVVASFKAGT